MNTNINQLFSKFPRSMQPVAQKLHATLIKINPHFSVGNAWSGIGYKVGKNYSCIIHPYSDHINLMIFLGVDLHDRKGMLQGKGINTRHLKFSEIKDIDEKYIQDILSQQFAMFYKGINYKGTTK